MLFARILILVIGLGFNLTLYASTAKQSYEQGIKAFKEALYDDAIGLFKKAEQQGFESGALHMNLASAYLKTKNYEKADIQYEKAMQYQGWDSLAQYQRGLIAYTLDNYADAAKHFSQIIESGQEPELVLSAKQWLSKIDSKYLPRQSRHSMVLSTSLLYGDNIFVDSDEQPSVSDQALQLNMQHRYRLSTNPGNRWKFTTSLFSLNYQNNSDANYHLLAFNLGNQQVFQNQLELNYSILSQTGWYGGEPYIGYWGIDGRVRYAFTPDFDINTIAQYKKSIILDDLYSYEDGDIISFQSNLNWALPWVGLTADYRYRKKNAGYDNTFSDFTLGDVTYTVDEFKQYGYKENRYSFYAEKWWGNWGIEARYAYQYRDYQGENDRITYALDSQNNVSEVLTSSEFEWTLRRQDERLSAGITVFKRLSSKLESAITVDRKINDSNIAEYDYQTNELMINMTYVF